MARQVILFSAHPVREKQAPVHQTAILVDETTKKRADHYFVVSSYALAITRRMLYLFLSILLS